MSSRRLETARYADAVETPEVADDRRHASHRVADLIEAAIDAGEHPPGSQLPPYRQIANEYGIAINTAQAAVRLLNTKGRVRIKPNSGTYVCESHTPTPSDELREIRADVTKLRRQLNNITTGLAEVENRVDEATSRLTSEGR